MRSNGSNLIVTTINTLYIHDESFNLIDTVDNDPDSGVLFTSGTINDQDEIFIGTLGIAIDG